MQSGVRRGRLERQRQEDREQPRLRAQHRSEFGLLTGGNRGIFEAAAKPENRWDSVRWYEEMLGNCHVTRLDFYVMPRTMSDNSQHRQPSGRCLAAV